MAIDRSLIQIDTSKLKKLMNEFNGFEDQVGEATVRTLNSTIKSTLNRACVLVSKEYSVDKDDVKKTFYNGIKFPTSSNLNASLTSKGHRLSFAHFPFSPETDIRAKKGESIFKSAVFVEIKLKKGPILSKKGFVASTGAKSADKVQFNVFRRLGKERFPIAPIRTLSIPQMITNEKINDKIGQWVAKSFEKKIDTEMTNAILRIGDKIR